MKKRFGSKSRYLLDNIKVEYICRHCGMRDEFPLGVVRDFDRMSGNDSSLPPVFCCQQCGGDLYPEYYKGVNGVEYKFSDL